MLEFDLQRESGRTWLQLRGPLTTDDDADGLREAFAFVAPDDHLIVDLTDVERLDDVVSLTLRDLVTARAAIAETDVVSGSDRISMHSVLHDIDRLSPIVPSLDDAHAILDSRWASRRAAGQVAVATRSP